MYPGRRNNRANANSIQEQTVVSNNGLTASLVSFVS